MKKSKAMKKFKVMAFMTTSLYIEVEAETENEAVAIAKDTDGGFFTRVEHGGEWEVADCATPL
tara:strand:- start:418 stop:606 length:189 start_codon:yes stop_codon:yes gene_type:complete